MSELLEDNLMTREEVSIMFQALPKARGRGSSSYSPAIDIKGFLEFARKVNKKGDLKRCSSCFFCVQTKWLGSNMCYTSTRLRCHADLDQTHLS